MGPKTDLSQYMSYFHVPHTADVAIIIRFAESKITLAFDSAFN